MTEQTAPGKLVVLEGVDGVGKTTLAEQLVSRLRHSGIPCEQMAFPGMRPGSLGRLVYDLHHDARSLGLSEIDATSLQLLHIAAHVDAIEGEILPALREGKWIILDRFWWSTWVYGAAQGVPERSLENMIDLEKLHWGEVKPDLLFVVEREVGAAADVDKLHKQLLDGYRALVEREKSRTSVVVLGNVDSVEDALAMAWKSVAPFVEQLTTGRDRPVAGDQSIQLTLPEGQSTRAANRSRLSPASPTAVYDSYWRFAAERQEVFFRRLEGCSPPWTQDSVLAHYKFTNAYRASDRVSQYLIRNVIYEGPQSPEEVFFRTLLFKIFNKIETWELLEESIGEIRYSSYGFDTYDGVLSRAMAKGRPIYSAAYIMPSAGRAFGYDRKHSNHLKLVERMMSDDVPWMVARAHTMQDAFTVLRSYPSIGDFLAYQFVTDLNYSEITEFSEMEFVVPGPGALDGIRKCFTDLGGLTEADLIRVVADRQEEEFERLGLQFRSLWGRRLQLIDCQNLFCEVSKYSRVKHPEVKGVSGRTRIKQVFRHTADPLKPWYPPKWGINSSIASSGDSDV